MAIRILLVDDHSILREGVARLLETQPDLLVLGSTGDPGEALELAVGKEFDVAIVDVAVPGMNGIELATHMLDEAPSLQVVVLSMHANPEYVAQALQAGALGYVLKEAAGRELVDAVRAAYAGQSYLCSHIDRQAVAQFRREHPRDPLDLLSPREREVLQLTVEGSTSADTARRLGVSIKSIETYRYRLMQKLGIDNLVGLVKFAIRRGLTSTD